MKGNYLWGVIIALLIANCLTVAYFLKNDNKDDLSAEATTPLISNEKDEEIVATIGDHMISRQQWLNEMENRYGKQTLEDMIDEVVVREMAKKYNISVSDESIDRELKLFKTMYNSYDTEQIDDANWRTQIELSLLLEELLTKDAVIAEEEIKKFYDENKELYEIPKSYHLSHIVVETKEEAEQVHKELEEGSSFTVLAMEKSRDEFTSYRGGQLGFVSNESSHIPISYLTHAEKMKPNTWSEAIKIEDGYAIIFLHEMIDPVSYSFDEVKDQIKRQIAIEQMSGEISVKPFWDELDVNWFYEKSN